jgi:hypothetical protein
MKKLLFFTCLLILSNLSIAQNTMDICLGISKKMNISLPRDVDTSTRLEATSCIEDRGKIYFQFVHTVLTPSALPKDIKKLAKDGSKKQFCPNIEFKESLKFFSYDFYYVTIQKQPIFSFTISKNDC